MRVWRLCKARHAATAFTGEGGHRVSGRWHAKGTGVIYTSRHLSLAALETLVHMAPRHACQRYTVFPVDIPDELHLDEVLLSALPSTWRGDPPPESLQSIGTAWVQTLSAVGFVVPSAIIPDERNVLLNPLHPDFGTIHIGARQPFTFDKRLRLSAPR